MVINMEKIKEILDNDKNLIIVTILIFGCLAMLLRIDGSIEFAEKLATGLFGMAVGRSIK